MNEKILVVDDEKELADLVEVYLKNEGFTVYKYYNGTDALKCVESDEMNLAILDVMLPDIDGYQICQKIREKFNFPVIMLTAKVEDRDKIMGLSIADDYITKPFNPLEMVARVKAQLRQYMRYKQPQITTGVKTQRIRYQRDDDQQDQPQMYLVWKRASADSDGVFNSLVSV